MNELFNRTAVVEVGKYVAGGQPKLDAKRYAGFRVTFEIDKTSEFNPNHAKIVIYNLQRSSRSSFEQENILVGSDGQAVGDPSLVVILSAGYSGLGDGDPIVSQIYVGNLFRAWTERHGADIATTLECFDSGIALRGIHVDKAYGPGTSPAQVIKDLAAELGLTIGTIVPAAAKAFQHGLSLSGTVSGLLDELTGQFGLEFHVTDGVVNVLDPSRPTSDPAILVSTETGLIGFPTHIPQARQVAFKCLLNPQLRPGRAVSLQSDTYTGLVRITRANYRGDTHGGEFSVSVEARPIV